ncbi:MAG: molybdopterin-dependent oxidoreductase, partial [Burkholderiales bacterium]|nr:molybdopterin-dependent oxidoreductase [Burkholderiales bacterium]
MNLAFRLAAAPDDGRPRLPGSLQVNRRLSQWLTLRADGAVEVRSGKVEIGQGILTALAQIVAEELEIGIARIRMVGAVTGASPDEAVTSGSMSTQESGTALRHAAAEARALFVAAAAQRAGVAPAAVTVVDGDFHAGGAPRGDSYWSLAGAGLLEREATGTVAPRAASALALVGTSVPRVDLPDKVFGAPRFIHDLAPPDLLHGAVLRPPSPAARLLALDEAPARALPGVHAVVRDGSFVGVLAAGAPAARAALAR